MRDGVTLIADVYRPEGDGRHPVLLTRTPYDRHGGLEAGPALASHGYVVVHAGRPRPLRVRGRVLSVPQRGRRRVRHRGVGGRAAQLERQGGDVRRLVRRRHADAGGGRHAAAPRRHPPRGHRIRLLRGLDVPGRRLDAMVRQLVGDRSRRGHPAAARGRARRRRRRGWRRCPSRAIACSIRRPCPSWPRTTGTGWRTRPRTTTGARCG